MTRAALLLLVLPTLAIGQFLPERELELCRQSYELGKYGDALERADNALGLANFTDAQRRTLHQLAGLSAFNLGDQTSAKTHFRQLLLLDPDHELDPFAVAPLAIRLFESVRRDNADALSLARQQLTLKLEQERLAKAQADRERLEADARRSRLDELSRMVTVRTVERHPLWVNFLPFGAGQFQQGRIRWGASFAVAEGILAIASIVSYLAITALYQPYTFTVTDRVTPFRVTISRIPAARQDDFQAWTTLKYTTGIAFYAAWVLGVGEALLHHRGEVISETRERLVNPDASGAPPSTPPGDALIRF